MTQPSNLLFGSNGVGKTSLLEGLEFLYCGANRRSAASTSATVQGRLISGHSVNTRGQQPLSDFKTRQRLWYGGDDNSRQNKLPNQFARFNFLNTDAAAELSLLKDDSKASNAESLAALLSGHETTLMWRRIQDVRKAFVEEIRSKRSERAVAESEYKAKELECKLLEAAPGQSDSAFSVFVKDLERIGWRALPFNKHAITEQLVEALSDLTSQLNVIHKIDWLAEPVNADSIAEQAAVLLTASLELKGAFAFTEEQEKRRSILVQRQGLAQARLVDLAAIPPTILAELKELSSAFKHADYELAQSSRTFAALPTDVPPECWEAKYGSKSVQEAYSESSTTFHDLSNQLGEVQQRLAAMKSAQSQLQNALAELHAWAQKVVEHRHSDSNCPVCGTEFVPGELFNRMQLLSQATSDDTISELRLQIEQLTSHQVHASSEASWLGQLNMFTHTVADSAVLLTVRDAQRSISSLIERQQTLLETRKATQEKLEAYARVGMSLESIERLCMSVEGDERLRQDSLDVLDARESVELFLRQLQIDIGELDERVRLKNDDIRHRLNVVGIPCDESLIAAFELLMARQKTVQHANEVCASASNFLDLTPATDLNSLLISLEASVLGAQKVVATLKNDSDSSSRLTALRTLLSKLSERRGRISGAIDRLMGAQRVLDDIIENQSLDAASAAVVAATHKVADSIFGRIHAPAEYKVTADAETPLRARGNNSSVQLNQVSTGQRAAYALSMFLAMNSQVQNGPKVILLDDPISHIDDLNALSFLDYLRNLVLNSDRQVFFATADEKIAGLFAHKFGFLGDEFRTIELNRTGFRGGCLV